MNRTFFAPKQETPLDRVEDDVSVSDGPDIEQAVADVSAVSRAEIAQTPIDGEGSPVSPSDNYLHGTDHSPKHDEQTEEYAEEEKEGEEFKYN